MALAEGHARPPQSVTERARAGSTMPPWFRRSATSARARDQFDQEAGPHSGEAAGRGSSNLVHGFLHSGKALAFSGTDLERPARAPAAVHFRIGLFDNRPSPFRVGAGSFGAVPSGVRERRMRRQGNKGERPVRQAPLREAHTALCPWWKGFVAEELRCPAAMAVAAGLPGRVVHAL